jgi:hypothetical protein
VIVPVDAESAAEVPSPKSTLPEPGAQDAWTRVTPCDWLTWSDPPDATSDDAATEPPTEMTDEPGAPAAPAAPTAIETPSAPALPG